MTAAAEAVAPQLGVGKESVPRWVVQAQAKLGVTGDENEEIKRLKAECIRTTVFQPGPFRTLADVEYAIATWGEWYNNQLLRSTLGMVAQSSTSMPTTTPATESANPYTAESPGRSISQSPTATPNRPQ